MPVEQSIIDNIAYQFPGWPPQLLDLFVENYIDTAGDWQLALSRTRADPVYADLLPGMVRDDGSLRFMTEGEYFSARDTFDDTLTSIGLNPTYFAGTFVQMLEGEVSSREQLDRIESAYTMILDRAPEIQSYYATNYGLQLSPEAIMASFLDPTLGTEILNRRISVAQIGGQAAIRDINVDFDMVERLYESGIDVGQATEAFGQAADVLPVLDVLAARHNDPDDTFDINEFLGAQLLDDPFQRARMRRNLAMARASFTAAGPFTTDREGQVRGLTFR